MPSTRNTKRSDSPLRHLEPDGRGVKAVPNEAPKSAPSGKSQTDSSRPNADNTDQTRDALNNSTTTHTDQHTENQPSAPADELNSSISGDESIHVPNRDDIEEAERIRQLHVSRLRQEEHEREEDILHDLNDQERLLLEETVHHSGQHLNLSQGEEPLGREHWKPAPQRIIPLEEQLNRSLGDNCLQYQYVSGLPSGNARPVGQPERSGPTHTSSPIRTTNRGGHTPHSRIPATKHTRPSSGNPNNRHIDESAWITSDDSQSQSKVKQPLLDDPDKRRTLHPTRYYTGTNVDRFTPPPSYVSEQRDANRIRQHSSTNDPISPIPRANIKMDDDPPPSPKHHTDWKGLYPQLEVGLQTEDDFNISNFDLPGDPEEAAGDALAHRAKRDKSPPHRFISGVSIEAAQQFAKDIKDNKMFDLREKKHIANIFSAAQDGNTSFQFEEDQMDETFYPWFLGGVQTISIIAVPNIEGVSFTKNSTPLIEKYYRHSLDQMPKEEKELERLLTKRDETMLQLKYYNQLMAIEMAKKKTTIRIALIYYYHNMVVTLAMKETLYTFAILQHFKPERQETRDDHGVRQDAFAPLMNCWHAASKFIKSCRLQLPAAGKHIHPLSELPSIVPFWQIPPDSWETDHLDYPYNNKVKAAQMTYLHLELQHRKPMSYLRKLIKKVFTHEDAQHFLDMELLADNSSHRMNRDVLEKIGNRLANLVRDVFSYSLSNTDYKNYLNRLVRAPFTLANMDTFIDSVQTNADFRQLVAANYRQVQRDKRSTKADIRKATAQFAEVVKYLKAVGYEQHGQEVAAYQDALHTFNRQEYYDEWTRSTKDPKNDNPNLGSLEAAMKKARQDALNRQRQRLDIAKRKKRVFQANDIPVDQALEDEITEAEEAVRHKEETLANDTKRDSHYYRTCMSSIQYDDRDEPDRKLNHSTFRPVFESSAADPSKGAGGTRPPSPKSSGKADDADNDKKIIYESSTALPHSQKVYYGHQGNPEHNLFKMLKPKPDASEAERVAFMLMQSMMMPKELKFRCRKFDGDPLEWIDFWEAFTGLIDIHPHKTELEKFMELNSLLSYRVRQKISHLKTVPENYQKAKDILCKEYGRLDYIVNAAVEQYDQVKKLPEEPSLEELEEFYNKTSTLIQLVQKHNKDLLYNRFLLNKIEARLHKRFFFRWRKILKKLYENLDYSEQRLDDAAYDAFLHHFRLEIDDVKEQQRYNRDALKINRFKPKTPFKPSNKSYAATVSAPPRPPSNNNNNNPQHSNKLRQLPRSSTSRPNSRPPMRNQNDPNRSQRPRSLSTNKPRFNNNDRSKTPEIRPRSASRSRPNTPNNNKKQDTTRTTLPCIFCKKFHDLSNCPNTNPGQRMQILRSEKRCYKCFREHHTSECTSKVTCKVCRSKNHHTALHLGKKKS